MSDKPVARYAVQIPSFQFDSLCKAYLVLHCLRRSVQTNVYLFTTSDATSRADIPHDLALATVDTLDPLTIEIMRLGRQMVQPYTQGIVTEMAYISVTNIQMLCANHETQSVSGGTFPPSSNRGLVFNSPIAGLLPFASP